MRALPLALLAALGCTDAPAPAADVGPYRVVVDSLVVEEPGRRYTVRIGAPQIEVVSGAALPPAVEAVNAAVRDSVEALAAAFRPGAPPPPFASPAYAVAADGGPTAVYVTDRLLSALLAVDVRSDGAAGTPSYLPLAFDLGTGAPLRLGDLFRPAAPWGDTLAAWAARAAARAVAGRQGIPLGEARRQLPAGGLEGVRRGEVAWTLGPDALHLWVLPSQLAPDGAPLEVAVPYAALAPLARPEGPLPGLGARER